MINALNNSQLKQWFEEGYVLIQDVIPKIEVKQLLTAADKVIEKHVQEDPILKESESPYGKGAFRVLRAIEKAKDFDVLIDYPKIFNLLISMLGPYLQIMSTDIFVRNYNENVSERFHTDAGPSMQKILPNENTPPIQLKVQFFLTDTLSEDCGNFMLIPGSHRKLVSKHIKGCFIPEANCFLDDGGYPPNTIQVLAKAGDIVIFPWALWHGASRNLSNQVRRSISFRYGQLWCRPYDYINAPIDLLNRLTLRQRRLFGDLGEYDGFEPSDYYKPADQLDIMYQN